MTPTKVAHGILAALLLAGCADPVTEDDASPARRPITFDCTMPTDTGAGTRAASGHPGDMSQAELYETGFGVFACLHQGDKPNMMYNQEVTFTFVGDIDPRHGFWSYSPTKYWPTDVQSTRFCAYAPYVAQATDDGTATGIIGMSANDATTPYIIYRRPLHPEEAVDLLWSYAQPTKAEALKLTMHHALARLRPRLLLVNVPDDLPDGTKVLVRKITLQGTMALTGRLRLNQEGETPAWTDQTYEDRTIVIDSSTDNADSYGTIDNGVRYVDGLPYGWQPGGLEKGVTTDVLFATDHPSFVFLVPQPEALRLKCRVDYVLMTSTATTEGLRRTDGAITVASPLCGNTTYDLTIKLNLKDT